MSRSRRRRGPRALGGATIVVAVLLLVAATGHGTGAFATGDVGRHGAVDVTVDGTGAHGIDAADAVHVNSTERFVTVTNRLARDATVTVSLRNDSTDAGDLVVDGTNYGDGVTLTLARGDSRRIDIAVPDDSSLVGRTVYFDCRASAPGLHVAADDRGVPVES